MGVAHQFCLSHQICCPIPATIKNCFTSLKGLCGVLFVLVLWWLYSRTTDAQWSLFSLKSQTFEIGQIKFGALGVFSTKLSAPILVLWVLCPCFPLSNQCFYKKTNVHIPNLYLGLGFEFGPQRIKDLAFVCL